MAKGYTRGTWGTYRQWANQGAQVRKGEKSSLIVFYKKLAPKEGEPEDSGRLVARSSAVFNAEQVDGYDPPDLPDADAELPKLQRVEKFVACTGADIRQGGGRAFYQRAQDYIQIPKEGLFQGTKTSSAIDGYYQTLLHELTHNAARSFIPRVSDLPLSCNLFRRSARNNLAPFVLLLSRRFMNARSYCQEFA